MEVSGLHIYPLKSGAAVSLDETEVTPRGFKYDRLLMAMDPKTGLAVTQREVPGLALVRAAPDGQGITFSAPAMPDMRVTWDGLAVGSLQKVKLHKDTVDTVTAPPETSLWLSSAIGHDVVLVFQPESLPRATDPKFAPGGTVSLADGYPVLAAFTASLGDLNDKISASGGNAVPMSRFRPNIVLTGTAPWEEDSMARVRIGALEMDFVKACSRCVMTTVDQDTGVKQPKEPLRTLTSFRFSRELGGVLFAENVVPLAPGVLRVGDRAAVVSRKPAPQFVVKG